MVELKQRLDEFLSKNKQPQVQIQRLTPDASTREYFRISWNETKAIACVYQESFVAAEQSYLDVSRLFLKNGIPVAEILAFDEALGIIVQENLGDTILRDVLSTLSRDESERLIDDAIRLIARIQSATSNAISTRSIASKLKFDTEKLTWELEFFREHYFETLRKRPQSDAETMQLREEFIELSKELESKAAVLCHRDFHAANLMVDLKGRLRIIDHQDARLGSAAYDLVSLLLDRVTVLPTAEWLASKRTFLIEERTKLGLGKLDEDAFAYEFRLQTIQRCLKATGTFSYQSSMRGKTYFLPFIKPMFQIVLRAAENIDRFPTLQELVTREIANS